MSLPRTTVTKFPPPTRSLSERRTPIAGYATRRGFCSPTWQVSTPRQMRCQSSSCCRWTAGFWARLTRYRATCAPPMTNINSTTSITVCITSAAANWGASISTLSRIASTPRPAIRWRVGRRRPACSIWLKRCAVGSRPFSASQPRSSGKTYPGTEPIRSFLPSGMTRYRCQRPRGR